MPLRSLLYIGRAYERLVPPRSRYKKKIVSLPTPEFYTFYNGKEKWEKEKELRLSDAYIVKDGEPSLELKVKVINIRPEEHHEILEKCQVLKEYSQFMEIVQNYQISGEEEPYKKAIKECIEKGILADYLMRKGSEVVNMLLDEYDYETDIEVQREEAREEGRKMSALLCKTLTGRGSGTSGAGESSVLTVTAFSSMRPEALLSASLVTSNTSLPCSSAQALHSTAR